MAETGLQPYWDYFGELPPAGRPDRPGYRHEMRPSGNPQPPAEPPVCEVAMRRWRDERVRIQRAEEGNRNYWEPKIRPPQPPAPPTAQAAPPRGPDGRFLPQPTSYWAEKEQARRLAVKAERKAWRKQTRKMRQMNPAWKRFWLITTIVAILAIIITGEIVGFHWGRLSVLALRIWLKTVD